MAHVAPFHQILLKLVEQFLHNPANKQTANADENITSLAEVTTGCHRCTVQVSTEHSLISCFNPIHQVAPCATFFAIPLRLYPCALTMLTAWQEGHLICKKILHQHNQKVGFFC